MKIKHTKDYAQARAAEYPPITDQLDALWKALEASGLNLPVDTRVVLNRISAVKKRYPKS